MTSLLLLFSLFSLSCLALLLTPCAGLAQTTTGTLEGTVTDSLGIPLQEVLIAVRSPELQGVRTSITDEDGTFRLLALPIGEYSVRIARLSYREAVLRSVRVRLGTTTSLGTIRLQAEAIAFPEVMVESPSPLIDPASTTVGGTLAPAEFEALPVQRTYDRIVALLPQANESYLGDGINVAGATGMENAFYVDGIDISDPYRGLTGASLPYNIVREIEVRNGAYEAEYRGTLGGVINVVTYAGGNEFSGRAFAYFTNNDLAGTPRGGVLEPAKGKFAQYDVGLGVGGPIVHDRLWFFVSYNPVFQSEDVLIPGLGYFRDRSISHVLAGNVTLKVSDQHSLVFSLSGDPTQRDAVGQTFGEFGTPVGFLNPDPYLGNATLGSIGLRVRGTHILGDNVLLESALSWMRRNDRYQPATEVGSIQPLFIDEASGLWSGGYPMRVDNKSTLLGGSLRGTVQLAGHAVKGGIEYRENRLDASFRVSLIQRFSPFAYTGVTYASAGRIINRGVSGFLQDSWEITSSLAVNAGVRWDGQFIIGSNGQLAQRILGQWQPRVGVIVKPGAPGTDKITASYGRFTQDLLTYASTLYHIGGATQQVVAYNQDPRVSQAPGRPLVSVVSGIQPEIDGMRGQSFDEFTLGYERQIAGEFVAGIRGVYRSLNDAIEDAEDPPGSKQLTLANPGRPPLAAFPAPERTYGALELTIKRRAEANPWFLCSYVLSRSAGNYPGLFNSDFEVRLPNANKSFDYLENMVNATGVLPNDRTHVLKLSGSYRFDFGLTAGMLFIWQSGTPLNEFGGSKAGGFNYNFLRPRGTGGRTPSLSDVNLRLTYDLPETVVPPFRIRLVTDLVHIGSTRTPVDYEQIHFFNVDANGGQVDPNPLYGQATRFQPPMSLRAGIEAIF